MNSIERFFVDTLLKISMIGVAVILVTDAIISPQDSLSIVIDSSIFIACAVAYFLRTKFPIISVMTITSTTLAAMFYQCLAVPTNTTTSLSVILLVGFIVSILLNGRLMWFMHYTTVAILLAIFSIQFYTPKLRSANGGDTITIAITYLVIYFILSYFSGVLKYQYNKLVRSLRNLNNDLTEKTHEIESQNEELLQTHESLNSLNASLEKVVLERTEKIRAQNEVLMKYSYTNAHHLRGPVARILGLAKIWKLESKPDTNFFFDQVEAQAKEIDAVIRQINIDLERGEASL